MPQLLPSISFPIYNLSAILISDATVSLIKVSLKTWQKNPHNISAVRFSAAVSHTVNPFKILCSCGYPTGLKEVQ
jgi:hypothetical protein